MLKEIFPRGVFSAPADEKHIHEVEASLNVRFPEQLRALLLECDGFREPVGNAKYLLSLTDEDHIGSVQSMTRFCWNEFKEFWPDLNLSPYVFFGSSSGDEMWGIRWRDGNQIIAVHHNMEGKYEIVGTTILDVYKEDFERYGPASQA